MINQVTIHSCAENGSVDATINGERCSVIRGSGSHLDRMLSAWAEAGGVIPPYQAAPPSEQNVIAERLRRLALGFSYDFGDVRGVHHIGSTDADMRGWDEVTKLSQAALALDLSVQEISIVTGTGPVVVTALEWQQVLLAAGAARQPIFAASFALQAMDPIPEDFATNEIYWS